MRLPPRKITPGTERSMPACMITSIAPSAATARTAITGKTNAQDVLFSAAGAMIAATMTRAIVASQTGRKRDDSSRRAQRRAQLEPLSGAREPVPSRLGTGRCRRLSHAFACCTAMLNYSPVAPWVTSAVPRGTATLRLVGPRVKWLDQVLSKTPQSPGC